MLREFHRKQFIRSWRDKFGRNLILPFEKGKGAEHYITKYTTKELAEWDLRIPSWQFSGPTSLSPLEDGSCDASKVQRPPMLSVRSWNTGV